MLKLGTVFSGIGAIEHALIRMGIPHKIVFACDNGDVDILSKNIDNNIEEVESELIELNNMIDIIRNDKGNDKNYIQELSNNLSIISKSYDEFLGLLTPNKEFINFIKILLTYFVENNYFNPNVIKVYNKWINILRNDNTSDKVKYFESMKAIIKVESDYKRIYGKKFKDSDIYKAIIKNKFNYDEFVLISNFKRKENKLKNIAEKLSMLHEKINTFYILKELDKIKDYKKKKEYVDNLYKGKESQNKVKKSYMANYDLNPDDYHWNVSFLDGNQYRDKIDLFVGGSPCQSFSLVGKQRGLEDTRGTLFYEYARLIYEIQPKVFIYENVKAVLSNDDGNTWRTMKKVFDDLNYDWSYDVLNSKDYGIPQNRERLFVVGFRKDIKKNRKKFIFPSPKPLEKTMKDFLLDNVSGKYYLSKKGVKFVTNKKNIDKRYTQIDGDIQLCQKKNQQFNWHGDFVFEEENKDKEKTIKDLEKYFLSEKVKKYVLSSGTKGFYSKPEIDLDIARPLLTSMHKMHRAGVDNYVTTEGRIRKLTPRECLRLMGFCDSFKIVVADTPAYQQAGNSIVVDVLIAIMDSIIESYPNIIK
ncbi:DNA cytosine methyltransferase [Anaerosalibacter sp. Marseille-P3206]|uniref:DNA cytosine methyltransferase n=1 Tax=Anaerosalibacter sp. Marseille-P3206 TaxID=1871005 RepID=UPI000985BBA5|nr:DNA (cytosine-5-)-methyltransferase [Anaerosalibacter sp. Marseille-P3206]